MSNLDKFVGVGITDDGASCHLAFRRPNGEDYQVDFDSRSIMKMIELLIQANTGALRLLESAPKLSTVFLSDDEAVGADPETGDLILTFRHDDGLEIGHRVHRSRLPKLVDLISRAASLLLAKKGGHIH